jgi:hypothetical protein
MAIGMPPLFSFNTGPVRPIGKHSDYDEAFDKVMEALHIARRQGIIDVVSSYDVSSSSGFTIGTVRMGGYPLDPGFMLHAYRSVAREQEVLKTAIAGDDRLMSLSDGELESLGISQSHADGAINSDPPLPVLEASLSREGSREYLTGIARARIASTMKSIGYCASKDLVPLFGGGSFEKLVGVFAARAAQVIDRVSDDDPYWRNRSRVLNLAHDEYINDDVLSEMPVDEVLKLRSVAWGKQAEAREELFEAAAELAHEALNEDDFDKAVGSRIRSYRSAAEEIRRERAALSFNIKCELLKGTGGIAASVMGGTAVSGAFSQMQTAMGAGTLLLAGCLWSLNRITENKPAVDQLRLAEQEFQDNICFGMHNFYRNLASGLGSDLESK